MPKRNFDEFTYPMTQVSSYTPRSTQSTWRISNKRYRGRSYRTSRGRYYSGSYRRRVTAGQGAMLNAQALWTPSFMSLGKSQKATLRYYASISLNPAVGVAADYVFSANGCYDPDITGVGSQPYGFDQMMQFFDHYTVIGSRCVVECANNNSTTPEYAMIMLRDNATSYSGTAPASVLMEPGSVRQLLAQAGSAPTVGTLAMGFSAKKFFSKNDILGEETYQGTVGSNPADQAYFHVLLIPQNTTDDLGANVLNVTIDYQVIFTEPKILAPS